VNINGRKEESNEEKDDEESYPEKEVVPFLHLVR
jgi:hypothetical protein